MWDPPLLEREGHIEFTVRTAACLGALGYSPHEVIGIIAEKLDVDRSFVAAALRCGTSVSAA